MTRICLLVIGVYTVLASGQYYVEQPFYLSQPTNYVFVYPHHAPMYPVSNRPPRPPVVHGLKISSYEIDAAFNQTIENNQIDLENMDADILAEVIYEATGILAKRKNLDLHKEGIFNAFSKVDVSKTLISTNCPENYNDRKCVVSQYREIDGSCNNLKYSQWGKAGNTFARFLVPSYGDGISQPRVSSSGKELPSARLVSSSVHTDLPAPQVQFNFFHLMWGQFLTHDLMRNFNGIVLLDCCEEVNRNNSACFPIEVPEDDIFISTYNETCMNFVRSPAGLRTDCRLGPREVLNRASSYIDASPVYANDPAITRNLRTFVGGKMRTYPAFNDTGLKDLLPLKTEDPDIGCLRPNEDVYCFVTGDLRANQNTPLSLMHTIFVREHNRLAEQLSHINPHWTDETLFQETRGIVGAMMQHISMAEYVPLILGNKLMKEYGLKTESYGYFDAYNDKINPAISQGFATAAFRLHSQIPSTLERWSKNHELIGSQNFSALLLQPFDLFKAGWADEYMLGLLNQPARAIDNELTEQVTNNLFDLLDGIVARDLASINIQRGRDHGIPSYNSWRRWCGLKPIKHWKDLHGVIAQRSIESYQKVYQSPEDIDLWSGGLGEIHQPGGAVGPTFACVIGRQFHNVRVSDRFWYENGGWSSSFTMKQLQEIKKSSLARMVCDNSDDIVTIQRKAMLLPDDKDNPRLLCKSDDIPRLNLLAWKDHHRS